MERSSSHHAWPEAFLRADFAFHAAVTRAVPGAESMAVIYQRASDRLKPDLMPVAEQQRGDKELSDWHEALARAVCDGHARSAARLALAIARRELAALEEGLG